MIDNKRPDVKPGTEDACADGAPAERTFADAEKPKADGEAIAELGDEVGGPA